MSAAPCRKFTALSRPLVTLLLCCCCCCNYGAAGSRLSSLSEANTTTAARTAARPRWSFIAAGGPAAGLGPSSPAPTAAGAAATAAAAAAATLKSPAVYAAYWDSLHGFHTPRGLLLQQPCYQQQQQQQQNFVLRALCCFEIALPEDTRRRRSRKGAARNPLKRLLKIPRGGWRPSSSNDSNSSNSSGSSKRSSKKGSRKNGSSNVGSTTALRCLANPAAAEAEEQHSAAAAGAATAGAATGVAAAATAATAMSGPTYVDIGANLCDPMYKGCYFEKQKHPPDIEQVLERATAAGVGKIILTTGAFEDFHTNLQIAQTYDSECRRLFLTVGIHPTRCEEFAAAETSSSSSSNNSSNSSNSSSSKEFDSFASKVEEGGLRLSGYPKVYVERLFELHQLQQQQQQQQQQQRQRVVAVGEIGLDYDRLRFCDAETQKQCFELQLALGYSLQLPLFLHMRNAAADFTEILRRRKGLWAGRGGVVHSFTGTAEEAKELLNEGLYIDAPWCGLRPTHAGFALLSDKQKSALNGVKPEKWTANDQVKGRNEPCNISAVGEVVRQLVSPNLSEKDFAEQIYKNTVSVFPLLSEP
ncbi:hydrolase, TatD family domain-containing protein, putative [Eimeria necatrix]|uniref:Hydrolase, TatD family domain-containing protein, putative n=1 Tax=Eimeria necatrix TaxID=51315 RepID=U6MPH9_9EIME|nr:hydrolase, TatD family domain-containing protein, putative [Eimeria necatrix]CDJ64993.1 hydrolase, TatD family domain-containing protein, putative [Eimeria necatrix]